MARGCGKGETLAQAHERGEFLRVWCNFCRTRRLFLPEDVIKLFGPEQEVYKLDRRIRCGGCDRKDYVQVEAVTLIGQEKVGITVRRLERVYSVRRVRWRDERR